VLEPLSLDRTRTVNYTLAPPRILTEDKAGLDQDTDFVNAGTREDREVVESIQAGIGRRQRLLRIRAVRGRDHPLPPGLAGCAR